jgi:threonine/homoserine/homoserine lactone efflux protein
MYTTTNLWLYFLVVFGVIILPGMDMAFVMGSSMVGGKRAGMAAVAGIVAGGICHMIIGTTGISIVLKLVPAVFNIMLLAGASYLAWIGWSLLRASHFATPSAIQTQGKPWRSFLRAMTTCLLNPKAYIFMLAIFPQFVHAERGSIWAQAATLSFITAATQTLVYGELALAAARAQTTLASSPRANAMVAKSVGIVLILAAALTVYGAWHTAEAHTSLPPQRLGVASI